MAATPAAVRDLTPTELRSRISRVSTPGSVRADEERPPVSKKVKVSSGATTRGDDAGPLFVGELRVPAVVLETTKEKSTQTAQQNVGYLDPSNLETLRETLSQQFDIEILLKHRELGLIEQEIAKTQTCIEQLRRCTLKPYQSPEISLEGYTPEHKEIGIQDYAPPHWSIINGPYTRHYQQWLLPDPRFDGWGSQGFPVYQPGKTTRVQKSFEPTQTYTVSGRPQRQSVIKVQQRAGTGIQQCIFRRSDGTTVRLECLDCKRSDFSSAQGFINHCRIAHQREYASHEAAAFACGQTVAEPDETFISPYRRNPVDSPSRNTRQTQILTPQSSYDSTPRGSVSEPSGIPASQTTKPTLIPKHNSAPNTSAVQRKNGRISSRSAMTTPKAAASEVGYRRPPTPPQDSVMYKTSHLEGLLKRKKIQIDLSKMVKEVKDERIDWDMETWTDSSSDESEETLEDFKDKDGDSRMIHLAAVTTRETTRQRETTWMLENQIPTPVMRQESAGLGIPAMTSARSVSRISSPAPPGIPLPPIKIPRTEVLEVFNRTTGVAKLSSNAVDRQAHEMDNSRSPFNMPLDGNYGYDSSSSDDEDGYKSDADPREDVEMEVESATSIEDLVSPINTTGIKPPARFPSQKVGSLPRSQNFRPAAHQTTAVPTCPVLPITTGGAERKIVKPAKLQIDQKPSILAPIGPAVAKQVRFIVPNSKNGARKMMNNPGGVLENGLARMKFGNVRKNRVFGSGEVRKMDD